MSLLPEVMAIAGPNGSGKSTVTSLAKTVGVYINADDIKRATQCSDMEAAIKAEELREACLAARQDFTFETVLFDAAESRPASKSKASRLLHEMHIHTDDKSRHQRLACCRARSCRRARCARG